MNSESVLKARPTCETQDFEPRGTYVRRCADFINGVPMDWEIIEESQHWCLWS